MVLHKTALLGAGLGGHNNNRIVGRVVNNGRRIGSVGIFRSRHVTQHDASNNDASSHEKEKGARGRRVCRPSCTDRPWI